MGEGQAREQLVAIVMAGQRRQVAAAVLLSHHVAARLRLSSREIQFMNLLDLYGPLSAGRLAELSGLSTGTVSAVLDRLEETGYARRRRDPKDRRRVIVVLDSERVAREIAPLYAPQADQLAQVLARYGQADLRTIADFVTRFAEASAAGCGG